MRGGVTVRPASCRREPGPQERDLSRVLVGPGCDLPLLGVFLFHSLPGAATSRVTEPPGAHSVQLPGLQPPLSVLDSLAVGSRSPAS